MKKEKVKVLFLEDNEDDFALILREFKKASFEIDYFLAENEKDFQSVVDKKWDVIISDYSLPGFNGFEALRICNKKGIETPFIVVSGTVGEDIAVDMMKSGAKDYIMKKDLARLVPAVERELEESKIRKRNKLIALEREVLFTISQDMISTDNLDELLNRIYNSIKKVIYAENCFIALYDSVKDEISFPFFIDKYDEKPVPMKNTKSLTDFVLRTGTSLICDKNDFMLFSKKHGIDSIGSESESWLGVPLFIHSKPIGVLVVQSYEIKIKYTENDKNFLEAIATDIAIAINRKRSQDALKESEEKYRVFMDSTTDMAFLKDSEFKYVLVNKANEDFFNKESKDIIGKTDFELMPEEAALNCKKSDELALKSDNVVISEEQLGDRFYETHKFKVPLSNDKCGIGGYIRDITERKNYLEALKKTENHYRSLIEKAPDGVVLISAEGKMLYASPSALKMFGYDKSDIPNINPMESTHPEDAPYVLKCLGDIIKDSKLIPTIKYRFRNKKGQWHWIESTITNLLDEPSVASIVINFRDITESKQAEEALKESKKRLTEAQRIGKIGNWEWIPAENKVIWSDEMYNIFGIEKGKIITTDVSINSFHPDDREYVAQKTKEALEQKKPALVECRLLRPNGEVRYIFGSGEVLLDEKENIVKMVGIYQDITDRKLAEESLKKSEERFKLASLATNDVIYEWDVKSKVGWFSDNYKKVFGYSETKIKFSIWKKLIHPEDVEKSLALTDSIIFKDGKTWTCEYRLKRSDGSYAYVIDSGYVIRDENGKAVRLIGTLMDFTERKWAEDNLRKSEEHYRTLLNAIPDMMFRLDSKGRIIDFHAEDNSILFASPEKFLGKKYDDILPAEVSKKLKNTIKIVTKTGEIGKFEYNMDLGNGSILFYEARITSYGDECVAIIRDITEQKNAEIATAESEERFRKMFEDSPFGTAIVSADFIFLKINPEFCNMMGYSQQELLNMTFKDLTHPDYLKNDLLNLNKLSKGEIQIYKTEKRYIRKDKNTIWGAVNVSAIRDKNEKFLYFLVIIEDITLRKIAEDNAKESQEKYRVLIENMNECVILVDNNDVIQFINKRGSEIYRYEPEELIGKTGYEILVVEEDWHVILEKNKSRLDSYSDSYEVRGKKKTGEEIWLNINGAPVKDNDGNVIGSVGLISDITARKNTEEELIKLSRAVQQSPASIIITDINGDIEYVNPKFVEITGYAPEEVIGENPRILKSGKKPSEEYKDLWDTLISGNDWFGEFQNKKKNGELFWESASISPIRNSEGSVTHYLAVKEDITEKKEKEIELIKAKEKAEESERLKSSFLANMSHELRTPMVGILGFAELMKNIADNPELKDFADNISKSGKRLLETLNLILDLSRIEAGRFDVKSGEINIVKLASEVYRNYLNEAEKKNLKFSFNTTEDLIIARIDERMIFESINNLVNNAFKFTKSGEIKIEVSSDEVDGIVRLKVSDTGIGIDKRNLNFIFEEFRQASEGYSRSFEGTGLGLTITKNFIEKNGGKILVESEMGIGTVFTIELPLINVGKKPDSEKESKEPLGEIPTEVSKDIKILCVDDDSFTREYLDYILRDRYKLSFAENGIAAIESSKSQMFSLILMDINLGKGIDGVETTRKIRKLPGYDKIPVIAMTAFAMIGDKEEFIENGLSDYISKPFKSNELINLVEKILKKQ